MDGLDAFNGHIGCFKWTDWMLLMDVSLVILMDGSTYSYKDAEQMNALFLSKKKNEENYSYKWTDWNHSYF
jgi:hypothetical protein